MPLTFDFQNLKTGKQQRIRKIYNNEFLQSLFLSTCAKVDISFWKFGCISETTRDIKMLSTQNKKNQIF